MSDWGDCVWVFGILRLFLGLFMDFGIYGCEGVARSFMGFWVSLGGSLGV